MKVLIENEDKTETYGYYYQCDICNDKDQYLIHFRIDVNKHICSNCWDKLSVEEKNNYKKLIEIMRL
jgi:hypothetical protein